MSADLGATQYAAVTWTAGDVITEAKMDSMVANDQAYDSHAAQGLSLNNDKALAAKQAGGTLINLWKINSADEQVGGGLNSGWNLVDQTWTYASATTINVPSGATSIYAKGDKIRLKQGGAYKYFYVTGVADTVLTVTGGTDYTVADAAITDNYYSHATSPIGFPQWFHYTPTLTGGGDITISSYDEWRIRHFVIMGGTVIFNVEVGFTIGGTGNSPLINSTLPVTSAAGFDPSGGATCYEGGWMGGAIQGIDSTHVGVIKYDGSNWSTGVAKYIKFSVSYQI